jgi:FAD/FMN-containing dehydrogenase
MASTTMVDAVRAEVGSFGGTLIGRGDPGYDEARAVHNGMIDRRPEVIARPTTPQEVAAVIGFARNRGLPLAVRGGGHSGPGLGVCDDGVVLDLSLMNEVTVDAGRGVVRAGGGTTLTDLDAATSEYGTATPVGILGTTGIGGLTLGGGIGHLSRRYGLTIDNLLAADMVLADGSQVRASDDENPDLFWAIRGGGGNFGVVTAFEYRLRPVGTVIAGPTFWSLDDTVTVMQRYRDLMPQARRELNGFFAFATVPPVPPFPEELHGRKVAAVVWCYCENDEQAAAEAIAPMLEAAEPLLHAVGPMPFAGLQGFFDPLYPKGMQGYWRADFVSGLPDELLEIEREHAERMEPGASTMHLYPIDGAVHDVPSDGTAFSARDAMWARVIYGVDPDPANADAVRRWTVDYFDATHPYADRGAYINFMMDEGQERVRATYRENYDRLAAVKAKYDPENIFRINQNIQPQG